MTTKSNVKLMRNNYAVGWVCALPIEVAASRGMLDEVHVDLDLAQGDKNIYTLGRIGEHNVVIACLPGGSTGVAPAARVAEDMLRSFPRIRFGLMVGIGGGAPSPNRRPNEDIRLGDVVVSIPDGELGAVIKYDRGKVVDGGEFEHTGLLNMPPALLTTAVVKLRSIHEFKRNSVSRYISDMVKKVSESEDANPDFEDMYQYQGSEYDQLFEAEYEHVKSGRILGTSIQIQDTSGKVPCDPELPCPNCDKSRLVTRNPRRTNDPVIHYGIVASADRVMRHGSTRERLRRKYGILCFEMEAAGLMNDFPCLVIRGICDYSDTHKHKIWQRYAAATAAAYAKELLEVIPKEEIEKIENAADVLKKVGEDITKIGKMVDMICDGRQQQERDKILTWLDQDTHTKKFVDSLERWQQDTCQQFFDSMEFLNWANKNTQVLWCPGIPGAGKTILASVVIKNLKDAQKDKEPADTAGIACLYCEHERQKDQTVHSLLAALLRQLADQHTLLPKSITELYRLHLRDKSPHSFDEISSVLLDVIRSFSQVFLIVDALDECSEETYRELLSRLRGLLEQTKMKLLATSRHSADFRQIFEECTVLEIRANDCDVKAVLDIQMEKKLSACVRTNPILRNMVKDRITAAVDGMFLLAVLFLDSLAGERSSGDVEDALNALMKSSDKISMVYEGAIKRIDSQNPKDCETAHRVLSWIVHAKRPLTCQELQHALAVRRDSRELQEKYIFHHFEEIVALCAGLVIINRESKTVQLVHHTTEIYLKDCTNKPEWITAAERDITVTCVTYLSFDNFGTGFCSTDENFEERLRQNPLYDYAARNWGYHARATLNQEIQLILNLLESEVKLSACCQAMMSSKDHPYDHGYSQRVPRRMGKVHLAAYFGLDDIIMTLLEDLHNPDVTDTYERTPLLWAAENGHEAVVRLLLALDGVNPDVEDIYGRTPLLCAAEKGHKAVVELLLAQDRVRPDFRSSSGRTPLSWAVENKHEEVVKLLLAKTGVDINSRDRDGWTSLWWAVENGDEAMITLLLTIDGINLDIRNIHGRTPLSWAAEKGHKAVVKLLLDQNKVNPDHRDIHGRTPLSWAAENGHEAVVKLLLDHNKVNTDIKRNSERTSLWAAEEYMPPLKKICVYADSRSWSDGNLLNQNKVNPDHRDIHGRTPLSWAAENGHEAVVKLLLDQNKVNTDIKRNSERTSLWAAEEYMPPHKICVYADSRSWPDGKTPLSYAAAEGRTAVVKLLLAERSVSSNSEDNSGLTPLLWAVENGHETVVELLLTEGRVYLNLSDHHGEILLSWAVRNGYAGVVKWLLTQDSVHINSEDSDTQELLWCAVINRHAAVVQQLLMKGINPESKNSEYCRTPLSWAAENGDDEMVNVLLASNRVDPDSKAIGFYKGWTPLAWAAERGHEKVVKRLLATNCVDPDSKSSRGQTPLLLAARNGHGAVVKLLLATRKVNPDFKTKGRTILSLAAGRGHETIVRLLIATDGVDPDSNDDFGRTPLSWAAENGHVTVVNLLLADGRAKRDSMSRGGRTPLWWAGLRPHEAIVELLQRK